MSGYEPHHPFRVWYTESIGRVPERLGTRSRTDSYPTLKDAREAARRLPEGCSFIRITDGPDQQLIEYPLRDHLVIATQNPQLQESRDSQ